jgi:hypothetical protein
MRRETGTGLGLVLTTIALGVPLGLAQNVEQVKPPGGKKRNPLVTIACISSPTGKKVDIKVLRFFVLTTRASWKTLRLSLSLKETGLKDPIKHAVLS